LRKRAPYKDGHESTMEDAFIEIVKEARDHKAAPAQTGKAA